jgi:hypothetical protein
MHNINNNIDNLIFELDDPTYLQKPAFFLKYFASLLPGIGAYNLNKCMQGSTTYSKMNGFLKSIFVLLAIMPGLGAIYFLMCSLISSSETVLSGKTSSAAIRLSEFVKKIKLDKNAFKSINSKYEAEYKKLKIDFQTITEENKNAATAAYGEVYNRSVIEIINYIETNMDLTPEQSDELKSIKLEFNSLLKLFKKLK